MKKLNEKDQEIGKIMEIKVSSTSKAEVLTRVESLISCNTKFSIVTPNPELILASQTNKDLKKALNSATFSIPDGVGLKIADPSLKIIKGRELFLDLIYLAGKKGWKVFLLGGMDNEAELAARKLQISNSRLQITSECGPKLNKDAAPTTEVDKKIEIEVVDKINKFKPQLLFVAFGNPKQEIWIENNLSKLNVGGAMAVGGTFRYVAGISKLPPKWVSKSGFEWLWRLITEPKRISRIFKAVIVFPVKILLYKISNV
jgi:N-acetylglucosaminyldiphosphoundecaprenol N-acetyl-beta-D-mannosaminyltransferase